MDFSVFLVYSMMKKRAPALNVQLLANSLDLTAAASAPIDSQKIQRRAIGVIKNSKGRATRR
jgi:hypothetical protein